jgi:hypothetical protein
MADNRELIQALMAQSNDGRLTPQQSYQRDAAKRAMAQGQKPVSSAPEALANMGSSAAGAYMLWKMMQNAKAANAQNAQPGAGLAAGFDNPGGAPQMPPPQSPGMGKPQAQQPPPYSGVP